MVYPNDGRFCDEEPGRFNARVGSPFVGPELGDGEGWDYINQPQVLQAGCALYRTSLPRTTQWPSYLNCPQLAFSLTTALPPCRHSCHGMILDSYSYFSKMFYFCCPYEIVRLPKAHVSLAWEVSHSQLVSIVWTCRQTVLHARVLKQGGQTPAVCGTFDPQNKRYSFFQLFW
jgi:hypothetical protein